MAYTVSNRICDARRNNLLFIKEFSLILVYHTHKRPMFCGGFFMLTEIHETQGTISITLCGVPELKIVNNLHK